MFTAFLVAMATARPESDYSPAESRSEPADFVPILRDERQYPSDAGEYNTNIETADGILLSESGQGSGPDNAVESQVSVRFPLPNGETFELTYVANAEGGYQPESSFIPVAPAFPHPIPQFVLDQIAKAAEEDRNNPEGYDS